jgi:RimJ/RimL family protein N-acetyltransferase
MEEIMKIYLRDLKPKLDFPLLADWFTILEDKVNSVPGLKQYYAKNKENIISRMAINSSDEPVGFYWGKTNPYQPESALLYLFVIPEFRKKGVGALLYDAMITSLIGKKCSEFKCDVSENSEDGMAFMAHRGFTQVLHSIVMRLDFKNLDASIYEPIIDQLKEKGFQFTNMEELGNTEENQRKLYVLNDTTVMDTPLWKGGHCWDTFEEFKDSVCRQEWYKPGGQMVVIDNSTGDWVAMSAITRFRDSTDAYNLFTGVDKHYRGQKLAQAVKVLALHYARDVLKTPAVRTNHNTANTPMIAIDKKLGYTTLPGYFAMEKRLAPVK